MNGGCDHTCYVTYCRPRAVDYGKLTEYVNVRADKIIQLDNYEDRSKLSINDYIPDKAFRADMCSNRYNAYGWEFIPAGNMTYLLRTTMI